MTTRHPIPPLQYSVHDSTNPSVAKNETVVLIHGFPDGPSVWRSTQNHLVDSGFRVVLITLPGFGDLDSRFARPTFDETVDALKQALVNADAWGATIIGHDWGAILSYMLLKRYPQSASRLMCLEIGCAPRTVMLTLFVLLYHALLNLVYLLKRPFGDWLVRGLCTVLPRPAYLGRPIPCARHAWLYHQAWREGATHGPWLSYYRNVIAPWVPRADMPFVFAYGKDGSRQLRFHYDEWRKTVTSNHARSRVIAMPGRHWFFLENSDAFHKAVDDFLKI